MGSLHSAVWLHFGSQAWKDLYNSWWTFLTTVLAWGSRLVASCTVWWDGWAYSSVQGQVRALEARSQPLFDLWTNQESQWAQSSQLHLRPIQALEGYAGVLDSSRVSRGFVQWCFLCSEEKVGLFLPPQWFSDEKVLTCWSDGGILPWCPECMKSWDIEESRRPTKTCFWGSGGQAWRGMFVIGSSFARNANQENLIPYQSSLVQPQGRTQCLGKSEWTQYTSRMDVPSTWLLPMITFLGG